LFEVITVVGGKGLFLTARSRLCCVVMVWRHAGARVCQPTERRTSWGGRVSASIDTTTAGDCRHCSVHSAIQQDRWRQPNSAPSSTTTGSYQTVNRWIYGNKNAKKNLRCIMMYD